MACSTLIQLSGSLASKIVVNPDLIPFTNISIQENEFENVGCKIAAILSRPQCDNIKASADL